MCDNTLKLKELESLTIGTSNTESIQWFYMLMDASNVIISFNLLERAIIHDEGN